MKESVKWIEENKNKIREAQDVIKKFNRHLKAVKAKCESDIQNGKTVQFDRFELYPKQANAAYRFSPNRKLLYSLWRDPEAQARLKAFGISITFKAQSLAEDVRESIELVVLKMQQRNLAGIKRKLDPEQAFPETGKRYSTSFRWG